MELRFDPPLMLPAVFLLQLISCSYCLIRVIFRYINLLKTFLYAGQWDERQVLGHRPARVGVPSREQLHCLLSWQAHFGRQTATSHNCLWFYQRTSSCSEEGES